MSHCIRQLDSAYRYISLNKFLRIMMMSFGRENWSYLKVTDADARPHKAKVRVRISWDHTREADAAYYSTASKVERHQAQLVPVHLSVRPSVPSSYPQNSAFWCCGYYSTPRQKSNAPVSVATLKRPKRTWGRKTYVVNISKTKRDRATVTIKRE